MHWLRTLNIAYVKDTTTICGDHFEDKYKGASGRLVQNAVPVPAGMENESLYGMYSTGSVQDCCTSS